MCVIALPLLKCLCECPSVFLNVLFYYLKCVAKMLTIQESIDIDLSTIAYHFNYLIISYLINSR